MEALPILKTDTCWIWQGTRTNNGYGVITRNKQTEVAHRYVYKLLGNELDRELTLDHLCFNKACVNPAHLEPVTFQVNIGRYYATRKPDAHCKRGHEFTPKNTVVRKNGRRLCKTCKNALQKKYYDRA